MIISWLQGPTAETILLYAVAVAVFPVLLYVGLIYWVDRYEKEPWWLLSVAFFWGAIPSALLAIMFNTILSAPFYFLLSENTADLAAGGLIAPVVEEATKAIVLLLILILQRHEFDSPLDGIIYGAMVGMGFAMVENVLYYVSAFGENGASGWNTVVLMRGVIFGLNHALYTALTGLGIAIARNSRVGWIRLLAPLLGLAAAISLHAFHNVAMFGGTALTFFAGLTFDWGGVLLTLVIIVLALTQERRWMKEYLGEEVGLGTLSAEEYGLVRSAARRNRHRLRLLYREGVRAYWRSGRRFHACSELAYRKRHHALFADEASAIAIAQLRQSLLDSA